MATNPIYVETEEEIPELVERLRRFSGEDTMLVLPMRSRIGQSRFNFQLLRNYAARLGKRVTVVCDDPAVQKMASESGFAVFGAVGLDGEGIASEAEAAPPVQRWWKKVGNAPTTHVGIAQPKKLLTRSATELKPGRFLLYVTWLPGARRVLHSTSLLSSQVRPARVRSTCDRCRSHAQTRKASKRRDQSSFL